MGGKTDTSIEATWNLMNYLQASQVVLMINVMHNKIWFMYFLKIRKMYSQVFLFTADGVMLMWCHAELRNKVTFQSFQVGIPSWGGDL